MTTRPRPISPHLQIYRFTITMAMSILHRITGAALYLGTLFLVLWLAAAAWGPDALHWVNLFYGHWLGQLVLFGYSWALFHHMLGGIRHFVWDSIHGLDRPARDQLAWANVFGSIVLTLAAWAAFVWA